jgi:hypothetical protein
MTLTHRSFTIDFFRELGLELEGRGTIEGEWAGRVTGLGDQRVEVAMMRVSHSEFPGRDLPFSQPVVRSPAPIPVPRS